MLLATWNVNSIRARLERVLAWLDRTRPDVVCLQELKVTNDAFPVEPIREAGYHAAIVGQKTYNGVAVLSRAEPADVREGLDPSDPQARLISVKVDGVRVLSAYVPNGSEVGSDKWTYKLRWLTQLRQRLDEAHCADEPLAICGDFNVATDDADVATPELWRDTVLCHRDARTALEQVKAFGLADVLRQKHPEGGIYTWWDYRRLAFPRNEGLRLDYIYATSPLAGRCVRAWVDRDERKGSKPSDHAPVLAEFDL